MVMGVDWWLYWWINGVIGVGVKFVWVLFVLVFWWLVVMCGSGVCIGCWFVSFIDGWIFWCIGFGNVWCVVIRDDVYLLFVGVYYCVGYLWYWWGVMVGRIFGIDGLWWSSVVG